MPARRDRRTRSLIKQSSEMAFAIPQVLAHRMTRMALAGPAHSARDRKEFALMGAEKSDAFTESLNAMAAQALRANQEIATSWLQSYWAIALGRAPSVEALVAQWQGAALGVLGKGMAPMHRKAVANAKRLARTRLK